jgi:hypothetical protein
MNIRKVKLMAVLLTGGMSGLNCSDAAKQTDAAASKRHEGATCVLFYSALPGQRGQSKMVELFPGMPFKQVRETLNREFDMPIDTSLSIFNSNGSAFGSILNLDGDENLLTAKAIEITRNYRTKAYVQENLKVGMKDGKYLW